MPNLYSAFSSASFSVYTHYLGTTAIRLVIQRSSLRPDTEGARQLSSTMVLSLLQTFLLVVIVAVAYIRLNDSCLERIPPRALQFSPKRVTPEDIPPLRKRIAEENKLVDDQMPPKTGRRYIVIGGVSAGLSV